MTEIPENQVLMDEASAAMAAQVLAVQNILIGLVKAGALTRAQAGSVAGLTADHLRECHCAPSIEGLVAGTATSYEAVASALFGTELSPG